MTRSAYARTLSYYVLVLGRLLGRRLNLQQQLLVMLDLTLVRYGETW